MCISRVWKALAIVLLAMLAGGCVHTNQAYTVAAEIDELLAAVPPSGGEVDFGQINGFAWDALYAVGPFTPHAQIEAALGFAWDEAKTTAIGRRDDINLLVFTNNGEVVASLELRRGKADFALATGVARFTPQTALFHARTTQQGALLLTPLAP